MMWLFPQLCDMASWSCVDRWWHGSGEDAPSHLHRLLLQTGVAHTHCSAIVSEVLLERCELKLTLYVLNCFEENNIFAYSISAWCWDRMYISGQTILLNDRSDRSKTLWSIIDRKANLRPGMGVQIWKKLIMEADFWYFTWWKASRK